MGTHPIRTSRLKTKKVLTKYSQKIKSGDYLLVKPVGHRCQQLSCIKGCPTIRGHEEKKNKRSLFGNYEFSLFLFFFFFLSTSSNVPAEIARQKEARIQNSNRPMRFIHLFANDKQERGARVPLVCDDWGSLALGVLKSLKEGTHNLYPSY